MCVCVCVCECVCVRVFQAPFLMVTDDLFSEEEVLGDKWDASCESVHMYIPPHACACIVIPPTCMCALQ